METTNPNENQQIPVTNQVNSQPQSTMVTSQPSPVPKQETSSDTKTIVTVLLLIFFTPVGLILMWFWTKWKTWVKILLTFLMTIPMLLLILAIFAAGLLTALNPAAQIEKANCVKSCQSSDDKAACLADCSISSEGSAGITSDTSGKYPYLVRQSFINSCVKEATANLGEDKAKTYCECTVSYLEKEVTMDDFTKYSSQLNEKNILTDAMAKAISQCAVSSE